MLSNFTLSLHKVIHAHSRDRTRLRRALPPLLALAVLLCVVPARTALAQDAPYEAEGAAVFLPSVTQDSNTLCRFGVNGDIADVNVRPLRAGWYVTYGARTRANPVPGGVAFTPTIRLTQTGPTSFKYSIWANWAETTEAQLRAVVRENLGAEWFISNEPDRRDRLVGHQDAIEPQVYAIAYQFLYDLIKNQEDPTATIVAGNIVQPTPVRIKYLDKVLAEYKSRFGQPMPVDAWATHNFILNEVRNGWGADIPPGIDDNTGMVIGVDDIIRTDLFIEQIQRFRHWLADNGYHDTPVYVSEFGVLFPDYDQQGNPYYPQFSPPVVNQFMNDTFDYMLTAVDPDVGYPADGNRLVQRFSWYSVRDDGLNGTLFTNRGELTEIGKNYAAYTADIDRETDFYPVRFSARVDATSADLVARIANSGNTAAAHGAIVRFYKGDPDRSGVQIGPDLIIDLAGCGRDVEIAYHWDNPGPGPFRLFVEVEPMRAHLESNRANNKLGPIAPASVYLPSTSAVAAQSTSDS